MVIVGRNANLTESNASVQEEIFRTLLKTPHRQGDEALCVHKQQFERDPEFYGHLAVWAVLDGNNPVRDLNEIFIAVMFASPYPEHRESAFVMLQTLPPYQVQRVCQYYSGWTDVVKHRSYDKALPENGKFGITVQRAVYGKSHAKAGEMVPVQTVDLKKNKKMKNELLKKGLISGSDTSFSVTTYRIGHEGLGKKTFNGTFKTAIRAYLRLREREDNRVQMEGALIRSCSAIHSLYYRSNTLPCGNENSWINRYIFKGETEEGSRLHALKKLSTVKDPVVQSQIIMDHKIPYPVAVSLISNMTPSVIVALIDSMSSQELLSNLGALQKRGAMDNADIKALIDAKLKTAKTAKRVDAMKGAAAAKAVKNLDADILKAVTEVTDTQLKKIKPINARVALLIDKSGSMQNAIELGKELAAAIAQACERHKPIVYTFDTICHQIEWRDSDGDITQKSSWDKKLKMVRADGGTCPGHVVRDMIAKNIEVDEIIVVTDEGENAGAYSFSSTILSYEKKFGFRPFVAIVRVASPFGMINTMTKSCEAAGIEVDAIDCSKIDQISMPNLVNRLARQSMFDLVQEIWKRDLPTKEEWKKANKMSDAEINRGAAALAAS